MTPKDSPASSLLSLHGYTITVHISTVYINSIVGTEKCKTVFCQLIGCTDPSQ